MRGASRALLLKDKQTQVLWQYLCLQGYIITEVFKNQTNKSTGGYFSEKKAIFKDTGRIYAARNFVPRVDFRSFTTVIQVT